VKSGERGPATLEKPRGIRATLTCAWCGREVVDAKAQRDAVSGHILLIPAASFRLVGGRPQCGACGGPLLLEDWRAEAPELPTFDLGDREATGGPEAGSAAA
jgi:hypothetical protein